LLECLIKLCSLLAQLDFSDHRVVKAAGHEADSKTDDGQDLEANLLGHDREEKDQRESEHEDVREVRKDISPVHHFVASALGV
jgi:hypothetical protein